MPFVLFYGVVLLTGSNKMEKPNRPRKMGFFFIFYEGLSLHLLYNSPTQRINLSFSFFHGTKMMTGPD